MSQSLSTPPPKFLVYNSLGSKNLVVIVDIDGLDILTTTSVSRYLQYGDPYVYGDPITYGQVLVPVGIRGGERQQQNLLSLDGGSFTISQKLEPEQGRGAISTISLSFIDKDGYMTRATASGPVVDEILGRQVRVWIGYEETAFPNDYFVVWRGRVGQVMLDNTKCTMQFVDPNVVRRQQIFYTAQTTLNGVINDSTTTIPVVSNGDFYDKILKPDGVTYDENIKLFIKIEDEYIEYQQIGSEATGFGVNQFLNVVRGAQPDVPLVNPSVAVAHDSDTVVDSFLQISGKAMDMALKLMMSGWDGPYTTAQEIIKLDTNQITLPTNTDAIRDLGIIVGDYITVSGDANPSNNISCLVTGFGDLSGENNRVIETDGIFIISDPSVATIAIRSQYDVWPVSCGCRLPGWEVDLGQFIYYENTFLSADTNAYRFLISAEEAGKTFVENQILLPVGAYSLTRQGKISVGITKPAIADQRTQILNLSNVIDPQTIRVQRGVNNRKFFNEIDWGYDFDDGGDQNSSFKSLDTDSLNVIGILSVLPITANGGRTDLGFEAIIANRNDALLNRYKRGSVLIDIKTTLGVGNQIEVGDIIVIDDSGNLKIPNFSTGERNIGIQLYEVINRTLDFAGSQTSLLVEGGTGAQPTDRYGTISPSSQLTADSTVDQLIIKGSFGEVFPGQEYLKWQSYIGLDVRVHSPDYSNVDTVTFIGFEPGNPFAMNVQPPLSFTPVLDDIVDIAEYPDNTDETDQQMYKLIHAFLDPSVTVVTGVDAFTFTVSGGDASKFHVGFPIIIHNTDYSILSPETTVASVVGTTITVTDSLGFTPAAGQLAEFLGFPDADITTNAGQPYRLV